MRPCWIFPTCRARNSAACAIGQVQPVPRVVGRRDRIARLRVERRRQVALDTEERLEHLADRLAEAFGGVLHARRLLREPAIPRRRLAHAAVIVAVDDLHRQQDHAGDHREHDERAVARAVGIDRRQEQPVAGRRAADRRADQHRVDVVDNADHGDRERGRARCSPRRATRARPARSGPRPARTRGSPRAAARETRSRRTSP